MRQSQLFTKTRRDAPKDEVSKNAQLLIRAGFVYKEMAGVYAYLPLGLRVFKKIENVIREEMNAIGGQEVVLTGLQQKDTWTPTNQWDDAEVDVWFKTQLKNGTELGLSVTHEAPIAKMMKEYVASYADLPRSVYQFQTKFRNETRAKSGIMRCREFVMKDLYSFSKDQVEHDMFYEKAKNAYIKIFERVGLGAQTYLTYASGGMFSQFSHEFQTITEAGEDIVYVHEDKKIAINKEVYTDDVLAQLGVSRDELVEKKAVEVGNIFSLAHKFSSAHNLEYTKEDGTKSHVYMGSYGIGPGRVMGTIVETLSDDKGIVWPKEVAPFEVHLVSLDGKSAEVKKDAEKMYEILVKAGYDVLFDDREESSGVKLKDADLIGIPLRVVVSQKTLAAGQVEVTKRKTGATQFINESDLADSLKTL